jgi:Protein of unknown function (DUF3012)
MDLFSGSLNRKLAKGAGMISKVTQAGLLVFSFLGATGCAPEVGSEAWCKDMEKRPKGDWTMNEAGEYAKNCIFRKSEEGE